MTIRAKREGRINVWPDSATALRAGEETPLAEVLHRLTVYDHSAQAIEYQELDGGSGEGTPENARVTADGDIRVTADGDIRVWE